MDKEDLVKYLNKATIYGGNYLAGVSSNIVNDGLNFANHLLFKDSQYDFNYDMGHPYAALFFGALDVASNVSRGIRSNVLTRLTNLTGTATFGVAAFCDLIQILNRDYSGVAQIPFNASMAYQLGKNTKELYGESESDVLRDLKNIGSSVSGFVRGIREPGDSGA